MSDAKVIPIRANGSDRPGGPPPNVLAHPPAQLPPGMPPILAVFVPHPKVAEMIRQNVVATFKQDPAFCEAVSMVRTNLMTATTERQFKYAIVLLDPMTVEERAEHDAAARKLLV